MTFLDAKFESELVELEDDEAVEMLAETGSALTSKDRRNCHAENTNSISFGMM